jgi:cell division protein FtsI (penicillin-binding protein 3)
MTPTRMIDCRGGGIEVAGHRFNDSHATKVMSYNEAMAVSSNVAAIKTGMRVGKENFPIMLKSFGFGQPTGVELPPKRKAFFRSPKPGTATAGFDVNRLRNRRDGFANGDGFCDDCQ